MDYIVDNAHISIIEKNYLKTTYKNKALLNAKHLEKIRGKYSEILHNEDISHLRLILIFEGDIEVSRDIGERYLVERVRPKIGEALVAQNPKTLEYLRAASAVMSKSHPVKSFSNEEEADAWLKNL